MVRSCGGRGIAAKWLLVGTTLFATASQENVKLARVSATSARRPRRRSLLIYFRIVATAADRRDRKRAHYHVLGPGLPAGKNNSSRPRHDLRPFGAGSEDSGRGAHRRPRHGDHPSGPGHPVAPRGRRRRKIDHSRAVRRKATEVARNRRRADPQRPHRLFNLRMDAAKRSSKTR
jgi:hypothetical protein